MDPTIRAKLEIAFNILAEILASDENVCNHPQEARIDMSTSGDLDHWVCGICHYDNKAVEDG